MDELKFWIVSLVIAICCLIGIWTFLSSKRIESIVLWNLASSVSGKQLKQNVRFAVKRALFYLFYFPCSIYVAVMYLISLILFTVAWERSDAWLYTSKTALTKIDVITVYRMFDLVIGNLVSGIWIIDRVFRLRWGDRSRLVEFPVSRCLIGCDVILLDCLGGRFCNRIR